LASPEHATYTGFPAVVIDALTIEYGYDTGAVIVMDEANEEDDQFAT
jgi:hypothetical protein